MVKSVVKKLTILGATGSVGTSALDLVRRNPDKFIIEALTANINIEELAKLAHDFKPKLVVCAATHYIELKALLAGTKIKISTSTSEAAALKVDIVIAAITGIAGLEPVLAAIEAGNTIALANKESLVAAGELVMAKAKAKNVAILPVDSEHNALFQALANNSLADVEKMIITASGGPFRTWDKARIDNATLKEALKHPNWAMGAKVTIDSASLMNKGLELIEAHFLFALPLEKLEVVVHPQSIIHGLVQFKDGSLLAQMGAPDMRVPLASCLAYPSRIESPVSRLNLVELGKLTFEAPDRVRFPCLALAENALQAGGNATLVLNAANEVAVEAFLHAQISFAKIPHLVDKALQKFTSTQTPLTLNDILAQNAEIKAFVSEKVKTI